MTKSTDKKILKLNKFMQQGDWVDFDENQTPVHTDTAQTLAFITTVAGVNFVSEFIREFAQQQGYSDERKAALEQRAHSAVERRFNNNAGVILRLVNHVDGLPIDATSQYGNSDLEGGFWKLTNAHEFNAFLEALKVEGRWRDVNKTAPDQNELTFLTPKRFPERKRYHALHEVIDEAILKCGGVNAKPIQAYGFILDKADPADGTGPKKPFIKFDGIKENFHYYDENNMHKTTTKKNFYYMIFNRLVAIKKNNELTKSTK